MTKADLSSERKNQIINATIECIARYGYHNFSMQDVARVADVSKGIIHYYFLNKEDLMMAVLDRVANDLEGLLAGLRERATDPADTLKKVTRMCLNIVQEKKEYYCINIDFWAQINQKEKVKVAIANHYAKFRSAIASILQMGISQGVFRPIDPNVAASLVISLVDGVSLQWLFDENVFNYEEAIRTVEDMVVTMFKV